MQPSLPSFCEWNAIWVNVPTCTIYFCSSRVEAKLRTFSTSCISVSVTSCVAVLRDCLRRLQACTAKRFPPLPRYFDVKSRLQVSGITVKGKFCLPTAKQYPDHVRSGGGASDNAQVSSGASTHLYPSQRARRRVCGCVAWVGRQVLEQIRITMLSFRLDAAPNP